MSLETSLNYLGRRWNPCRERRERYFQLVIDHVYYEQGDANFFSDKRVTSHPVENSAETFRRHFENLLFRINSATVLHYLKMVLWYKYSLHECILIGDFPSPATSKPSTVRLRAFILNSKIKIKMHWSSKTVGGTRAFYQKVELLHIRSQLALVLPTIFDQLLPGLSQSR